MYEPFLISLDELPPPPLTFKTPARLVAVRLRTGVGCAAAAALGWWWLHVNWLSVVLAVVALAELVAALRAVGGRVEVRQDGIRVHRLGITRSVPWAAVVRCDAHAGLYGHGIRIMRARRSLRFWLRLPAPFSPALRPDPEFTDHFARFRERTAAWAPAVPEFTVSGTGSRWALAIVAALAVVGATLLEQPWGWPSGPQFTGVGDPCPLAAQPAVALFGNATGESATVREPGTGDISYFCIWESGMTRMVVRVKRYARWGLHSATWRAKADYAHTRVDAADVAISAPRFADESMTLESGEDAGIIARRGNVLISVVIIGPLDTYYRDGMYDVFRPVVNALHAS